MKLKFGSCLLALSLPLLVPAGSLFPEFDEIPAALRFPRRAKVTISKDGDYLINGIPRFMIGTELDIERIAEDMMPTEGYPDNLKWLYEGPLSYRTAQRAGIDAISLQFPPNWIHEIYPAWKPYRPQGKNKEYASRVLANGLPIRMDTSCQFWKHGRLALKRLHPELHELLPQEAYGKGHFIEYNIFHPEARKIYKRYWEAALDMYQDELNRPPIDVELFNEPSYDDPSPYNRELFAKYLEEKYESVDAMNRLWRTEYPSFEAASQFRQRTDHAGLYVDWGKFMEKGMTDINRFGRDVVKSKSPSTTVSFQIMGMDNYRRLPATNMNSYEVQKLMDVIALPTGAGLEFSTDFDRAPARSVEAPGNPGGIGEGMLMRAFYLNVGEGKPLINAEAYTGNTFDMISNQLWMDMIRGTSITYLFGWGKGAQNWKPRGKAEGGKRFAEQYRYPVLNPYGKPPEAIAALYHTKAEIFRFNDYFVPRDRGVKAQVALLFSYPTERFGGFSGNSIKNEIRTYTSALTYAHYPLDVIMEEQLPEKRQEKYKAIVAAGIGNTYPETLPALEEFVRGGGILIAARDTMPLDEYGNPVPGLFDGLTLKRRKQSEPVVIVPGAELPVPDSLPGGITGRNDADLTHSADWRVIASMKDAPAVLMKKIGRGTVYFIVPQMQDYPVAAVAGGLLRKHGIEPELDLRRIPQNDLALNLEAHVARRKGNVLVSLMNADRYPKMISVKLPGGTAFAADLLNNRALPIENGRAIALVGAGRKAVLGFGPQEKLESEFGKLPAISREELSGEFRQEEKKLEAERLRKQAAAFRYDLNLAQTFTIDLRPFANSLYWDNTAGDGKGGWTDQGKDNSLDSVPWDPEVLLGVPCDFIRFDMNGDKSCIILHSKSVKIPRPSAVNDIPVNAKVSRLFFFHTAAWVGNDTPVMTYRIRYASGRTVDIPVVAGRNIGNWWISYAPPSLRKHIAWKNMDGKGIYLYCWENPDPSEEVRSIDLLSANNESVGIVIGITAERFVPGSRIPVAIGRTGGWGGAKPRLENGTVYVDIGSDLKNWAGVGIEFRTAIPVAELKDKMLKFEMNGGKDAFGNSRGGQALQLVGDGTRIILEKPDNDPDSFESYSIPVSRLIPEHSKVTELRKLTFQYVGSGDSGFEVRNITFEDNPSISK